MAAPACTDPPRTTPARSCEPGGEGGDAGGEGEGRGEAALSVREGGR